MSIRIEIIGTKKLERQFKKAKRQIRGRMRKATRETANAARRRMRRTLSGRKGSSIEAGNFSRGTAKSIQVRMEGTTALLTAAFPALIIERGTKPFFPPPAALEAWAGSKLGDPSAAYPVARAIAERGLAPSPFFQPALEAERKDHTKRVQKALFGAEIFRG